MTEKPLISVIVVTYNQERTIARTLDSILAQQLSHPYEIVIGEDCSTDSTRLVCEDYARRFPDIIRLMPQAPNKGVVRNYIDTLKNCRGEFIADCAGDDFWTDNTKLQRQADILLAQSDVSAVHTAWCKYDEATGVRTLSLPPAPIPTDSRKLIRAIAIQTSFPIIHLCTALYRKDIIVKNFDEAPRFFLEYPCEDLQIAYILAAKGKVVYLDQPTLCYSTGHTSVSSPGDELKQYKFFLAATWLSYEIVSRELLSGKDIDDYFQQRLFALAMHLFRADRPDLLPELQAFSSQWPSCKSPSRKNRLAAYILSHYIPRKTLQWLRRVKLMAIRP